MVRIDENKVVEYNFGKVSIRTINPDYKNGHEDYYEFEFEKTDKELNITERACISLSVDTLNTMFNALCKRGVIKENK